ncbi:hypothetical protein DFQ26_007110 [Actinomortierella ambigua]|nr:hypothetical protein DFQ26_007110 [Actinomortierella ambigua]
MHQFNDVHWNHLNQFDDEPAAQHHPILPVDSPPTCNQDKAAARVYKWEQDLQTIAFKLIDICSSLEHAIQWNGYDDWGHWGDRGHSHLQPDEGTKDKSRIPSPPTNLLDLRAMERAGFLDELQGLSRGANKILDMMEQYHRSGPPTRTAAVDHGPIIPTLTAKSRERPSCHEQEGSDALGQLVVARHEHRLKIWATDLRASAIGLCKVLTRHFVAKA